MNPHRGITLEEYFLTHTPTIAEIRRLNRETLLPWTLQVLDSLLTVGIDLDTHADAIVKMRPVITDDLVDMKFFVSFRKTGVGPT